MSISNHLTRSQFFRQDLAHTVFLMVSKGQKPEKLIAYDVVDQAGRELDFRRLFELVCEGLTGEYSNECVNDVYTREKELGRVGNGQQPSPPSLADTDAEAESTESPATTTTGPLASRHRNYIPTPPIVMGPMWLLPLLAKLLRKLGEHGQGEKMEKGYAILLDFMECELHSVKYYALEAVIAVLGTDPQFDRKAKQRLRQLAKGVLEEARGTARGVQERRMSPGWFAVCWAASTTHHNDDNDEDGGLEGFQRQCIDMLNAQFDAALSNGDVSTINLGLLYAIGSICPPALIDNAQNLLSAAITRDMSGSAWKESEIHDHMLAMRMAKNLSSMIRKYLPEAGHEQALDRLADMIALYLKAASRRAVSGTSDQWISVKLLALEALSKCAQSKSMAELISFLTEDDPSTVRRTVQALSKCVGLKPTVHEIVKAGARTAAESLDLLANSLRYLTESDNAAREMVVNQLEDEMYHGTEEFRRTSQRLLTEMGGSSAMRKLQNRTETVAVYRSAMKEAEATMSEQFRATMGDAARGFNIALAMDVAVFLVGVALIVASGIIAIRNNDMSSMAGVGVTGGTGVLATLYSLLVAKPREKVQMAVDHQMYLKVVFLGYLRELHQLDQSFTRRMMEDSALDQSEMTGYTGAIRTTMKDALDHLVKNIETHKKYAERTPGRARGGGGGGGRGRIGAIREDGAVGDSSPNAVTPFAMEEDLEASLQSAADNVPAGAARVGW